MVFTMKNYLYSLALIFFFGASTTNATVISDYYMTNRTLVVNNDGINMNTAPNMLTMANVNNSRSEQKQGTTTLAVLQNHQTGFHRTSHSDTGTPYDASDWLLKNNVSSLTPAKNNPINQSIKTAVNAPANDKLGFKINSKNGTETSIPLPAIVWLFGSALLGFLWFDKRKAVLSN
jgi:hypothetical protein